ncbi:glucosyl-3-phosphoglycerate synthase [Nocardioides panacisoli]|uniref:glucosyl-3-phosphoglycerate synthase n=1 Tax=Nocardioides panacisoli TaxID=627624 RepID=UPI001C63258B|nr:glucosyl-3-phosphoglycerate synthase [Nocardioides panacisoli]QYJ04317.1 glucosyl-3-phosphoglycerate synthase [Nocardioides panacisoli]
MDPAARAWFDRRTSRASDWPTADLLAAKGNQRVSVVVPARDEESTVGDVVRQVRDDLVTAIPLVDEVVVMDSLSTDDTAYAARSAGATVHSVADVRPDLGVLPGKGEALWKSLFVTSGDLVVFIDADLTDWGTHFVSGLLGPLLTDPGVVLAKGFYDRVLDLGTGVAVEGGRVTELVARPWLALHRPELAAVVQPLAGEWAVRRDHFASLPVPTGYGVEIATLLDTASRRGTEAIAQVDLGNRAHRHQHLHDLGAMATELLAVADRRRGGAAVEEVVLPRMQRDRQWVERTVPATERPPFAEVAAATARG